MIMLRLVFRNRFSLLSITRLYYYHDHMRGMIIDEDNNADITK